jgi:RNA-directed DNA polymerase
MLSRNNLVQAFRKVKSANGAPGVDGQSVKDFTLNLNAEIAVLLTELKDKTYVSQPVKQVIIPKRNGGERKLGIPSVRDRVVQQALLDILQPIFDCDFHPSSYGYRPKRSAHNAISKASLFIRKYDMKWVVDMDLSKCFDMLNHDLIIQSFKKRVTDGSILNLLRIFLESGALKGNIFSKTDTGSPQGGVISPFIANVYLDSFDKFTMSRNYRIVRYADDILIFCCSKSGAENALANAALYLEKNLKLKVNVEKTHITNSSKGIKFLGIEIFDRYTKIQDDRLIEFKKKLKQLTKRNSGGNLDEMIRKLNPVIRGFVYYFRIANCKGILRELMSWIRHRLRAKQMKLWKTPRKLHRKLRQLGYKGEFKKIKMSSWRNSSSPQAHYAMPNTFFDDMGLFNCYNVQTGITYCS